MSNQPESLIDYCQQLEPVFIWAPTTRCGTTLLQRLISTSGDVIVYGEFEYYSTDLIEIFMQVTELKQEGSFDEDRKRFAGGDFDFWCPHLKPDTEKLQRTIIEHFYTLTKNYQETAEHDGFDRWGIKTPEYQEEPVDTLSMLLPKAQYIFIYRNPYDVIRSQKGRGWVESREEIRTSAKEWNDNLRSIFDRYGSDDSSLLIQFEDLLDHKAEQMERIEDFLNCGELNPSVFETKVNSWTDEKGNESNQYIDPPELTEDETALIDEITHSGRRIMEGKTP